MNFTFTPLDVPGVVLVEAQVYEDARGTFSERFKQSTFAEHGLTDVYVQDNVSRSAARVLRGLHYQLPPFDQAKLVGVVSGEVFDVAVDMRKGSETYGRWAGSVLSEENRRSLYVPAGFAHGFLVTGDHAVVTYKTSHEYARDYERGVRWDDPDIGIDWPLHRLDGEPLLSERDRALPMLHEADLPAIGRSRAPERA